jgi:hypothetical protein
MRFIENINRYPMFAVGTVIFLVIGVVATVWARRIQRYAISFYERHPVIARLTPFRQQIYTDFYLFELRVCGILAFFVGVFCCWALWAGK